VLHPGWTITVSDSDRPKIETIVSTPFQIQVFNEDGQEVTHFRESYEMTLFGSMPKEQKEKSTACVGFSKVGVRWTCNPGNNDTRPTREENVGFLKSQIDHMTSFAVLLGPTVLDNNGKGNGDGDGWGWIQIASLVIIGSAFVLSILIGILIHRLSKGDEEEQLNKLVQVNQKVMVNNNHASEKRG